MHKTVALSESLFAGVQIIKPKRQTPPGESYIDEFLDRGSIPLISTNLVAGRTPEQFNERIICSTSRQCLHPIIDVVQCDAKLYTAMAEFKFESECSTSGKLPLPRSGLDYQKSTFVTR